MRYNIYDLEGRWLSANEERSQSHSEALILAFKKDQSSISYRPNHFYIVINENYPTSGSVQLFKLVIPPIPEIFAERVNDIDD